MPSSRRPPRPGASARPAGGSGPSRGTSGAKPSTSKKTPAPRKPPTPKKPSGSTPAASGSSGTSKKSAAPRASAAKTSASKPASRTAMGSVGTGGSSGRRPSARARASSPSRRATGPAPEDRRRSRYGFLLPEVVTVRTLVLSVVVLLAVVLLLPTVRAYVNQTGELRELRNELAEAQVRHDELEAELDRWDDQAYVEREARDRLNFVMPGERPWRVLDPDTVVDDIDPQTGEAITDGPVQGYATGTPWYEAIWTSVQVAGEQPAPSGTGVAADDAADDAADEPASGDQDAADDGTTPETGENG